SYVWQWRWLSDYADRFLLPKPVLQHQVDRQAHIYWQDPLQPLLGPYSDGTYTRFHGLFSHRLHVLNTLCHNPDRLNPFSGPPDQKWHSLNKWSDRKWWLIRFHHLSHNLVHERSPV